MDKVKATLDAVYNINYHPPYHTTE